METVDSPAELFKELDARGIKSENSYTLSVAEDVDTEITPQDEELPRNDTNYTKKSVEFTDISTYDDAFEKAHDEIRENATRVDSADDVPPDCNTEFHADENGNLATYYCNTSMMGYELVRQDDPKVGAYTVVSPSKIFRVES